MAAVALGVTPVAAQGASEPEPRIRDVEPRVLEVEARILTVEARIVDVVVPNAGNTEIPIAADVLFDFGSAALGGAARSQLTGVVSRIAEIAPSRVVVEGHTDAVGDDATNQRLSEQRAEAVRAALAAQVPGVALESAGFGEARPVAPNTDPDGNDNPAGRQQNRRVTLVIVP